MHTLRVLPFQGGASAADSQSWRSEIKFDSAYAQKSEIISNEHHILFMRDVWGREYTAT